MIRQHQQLATNDISIKQLFEDRDNQWDSYVHTKERDEVGKLRARVKTLESELETRRGIFRKREKTMRAEIKDLRANNGNAVSQNHSVQLHNRELRAQIETLRGQLRDRVKALTKAEADLRRAEAERDHFQRLVTKLEEDIVHWKNKAHAFEIAASTSKDEAERWKASAERAHQVRVADEKLRTASFRMERKRLYHALEATSMGENISNDLAEEVRRMESRDGRRNQRTRANSSSGSSSGRRRGQKESPYRDRSVTDPVNFDDSILAFSPGALHNVVAANSRRSKARSAAAVVAPKTKKAVGQREVSSFLKKLVQKQDEEQLNSAHQDRREFVL